MEAGGAEVESDSISRPEDLEPVSLTLDLTHACNCRCKRCIEGRAMVHSRHASLQTATACRLISLFVAHGGNEVLFYGGEPTVHPGFPRAVHHAARLAATVRLVTNGTRLAHPRVAEALAEAARTTNLAVRVSLNAGTPETHAQHFGVNGLFYVALQGMKTVAEAGVPLGVSFLLGDDNAAEIKQAYEVARQVRATDFWLRPKTGLHSIGLTPLSSASRNLALRAIDELSRPTHTHAPRFHLQQWHRRFLDDGTLPDTTKPYPRCFYCGASRIVITPPEPGVAWSCAYWRADERFLIADLSQVEFGTEEFGRRRLQAIGRICPQRDCAGVICDRNDLNEAAWERLARSKTTAIR